MNGFNNLQINGTGSPYTTHPNPSHTSIAAGLQRERGIPPTRNSGTPSNLQQQHPVSPLGQQPGESRQQYQSRTAPSITNNPIREVYNAERPTVGQPYAFPDPDMSGRSSESQDAPVQTTPSRRNSGHTSITSSIMTTDSKMPHGQISLEESTLQPSPVKMIKSPINCAHRSYARYAWYASSLTATQSCERTFWRWRLPRWQYAL